MYIERMRRTRGAAEETRVALRDAAIEVFAQRGYAAARLEEIAERAGVTRGALYHHFVDKAGLYSAAIGDVWWEVTAPIFAELEGDGSALERLERFVVAYICAIEENPRFRDLLSIVTLKTEALPELSSGIAEKQRAIRDWVDGLETLLAAALAADELRAGLEPRDAALIVVCFVNGVTTTAIASPGLFSASAAAPSMARALIAGFAR